MLLNKYPTNSDLLSAYLIEARRLPSAGSKRYTECPYCGTGRSRAFVVSKRRSVISCWCYRCHTKTLFKNDTPSIKDCLRTAIETRSHNRWCVRKHDTFYTSATSEYEAKVSDVVLPSDVTNELPLQAQIWLMKYKIVQQEVLQYGICWSPRYQRLIFPVRQEGRLVYWSGRTFRNYSAVNPKWLNVKSSKAHVCFNVGHRDSPYIILVEDILSALVVIRDTGYCAIALLGSHLNDSVIKLLLSEGKQVRVWLDLDKRCESLRFSKRLNVLGIKARSIITPLDPKEYTEPTKVQELVEGTQQGGVLCGTQTQCLTNGLQEFNSG